VPSSALTRSQLSGSVLSDRFSYSLYGERSPEIQCPAGPPRRITTRAAKPYGKLRRMSDDMLVLLIVAALLAGGYKAWQLSLDAREAANRIAKTTCSRAVVQLLDGTVAFAGFRLARDSRGKRRLLRTYTFDYTGDGFERLQGFIILAGLELEAVGLARGSSLMPPT